MPHYQKQAQHFRAIAIDALQPLLADQHYQLQQEFAHHHPPEIPDDVYLPFTKSTDTLGYIHIVISYSVVPNDPLQEFDILLLRYEGMEPIEAWAIPIPGRPRTNIAGYLPGSREPPLPLILSRHNARRQWQFESDAALRIQLDLVRTRLEQSVLSWLEHPLSTQFVHVDTTPFRHAFEHYVTGAWDAATAYAAIRMHVEHENHWIEAGDTETTYLVNEVTRMLFQLQLPHPIQRPKTVILNYCLACLRDEQQFEIGHYRELLRSLRPPRTG